MSLVTWSFAMEIDELIDPGSRLSALSVGHPISGLLKYDTDAPAVEGAEPGVYDLTSSPASDVFLNAGHGITWGEGGRGHWRRPYRCGGERQPRIGRRQHGVHPRQRRLLGFSQRRPLATKRVREPQVLLHAQLQRSDGTRAVRERRPA